MVDDTEVAQVEEGSVGMPQGSCGARGLPTQALLRAAVSGLLGLGVAACADNDDTNSEPDPDEKEEDHSEHASMTCECSDDDDSNGDHDDADSVSAGHMSTSAMDGGTQSGTDEEAEEIDKEISTENQQYTFAELQEMCLEREGYVEIHGACSGVNTCQGFFYGDWGEDAQLVEHTCSGVNGCNGLSCLVPGDEKERDTLTGEEIMRLDVEWYAERTGDYGPQPCKHCHVPSERDEETDDYVYNFDKLKLPMWPEGGRDASNWLDRSATEQEALVAFGAQGMTADGVRYSNMVSYAKLFSKEEIKAVVEYMRGIPEENIEIKEIKLEPGEAQAEP